MKIPGLLICLVATGLCIGCRREAVVDAELLGRPVSEIAFSEKNGIKATDSERARMGLELVEVSEQVVAFTNRFPATVFQSTPAGVLASGWLEVSMKDRLGSNAIFSATPGDGSPRPAKVLESRNALEWGETDLELVLSVDNLDRSIAMGSTLTVECSGVTDGTHLSIPREALLTLAGGHFVYAVNGDFLTRTPVKLGASGSERVEVVDGLLAGDQVVQKGAMALWMIEMQAINGGDLCCPAAGHK